MKKEGAPGLLWRSPGLLLPRAVLRPLDWLGAGPSWASKLSWSGSRGPHPFNTSVVWLYEAFKLLAAGFKLQAAGHALQVAGRRLQTPGHEPQAAGVQLQAFLQLVLSQVVVIRAAG